MIDAYQGRSRAFASVAAGGLALAGATLLGVAALRPSDTNTLISHSRPAGSYDEAIARFTQFCAHEGRAVAAYGQSLLYSHGQRTARALVLIHGLTNCPQQYVQLAPLFQAHGYNVIVPRMPHHGLADRDTHALARLTAEELRDYADEVIDIAAGLGREVTVAGISAGGVIAAWLAQFRPDLACAVLIAAAFRLNVIPGPLNTVAMNLFTRLPDLHLTGGEKLPHAYAADSTRGFGEVMLLGEATRRAARTQPACAKSVVVITNASDTVDNGLVHDLANSWQQHGLHRVSRYEFGAEAQHIHDLIDPTQAKQQTDAVYPLLLDLIAAA